MLDVISVLLGYEFSVEFQVRIWVLQESSLTLCLEQASIHDTPRA